MQVPASAFAAAAHEQGFVLDPAQVRAIDRLTTDPGRGIYLWGPVGRGKSWLMATYFAALPTDRKVRLHFHEFFRDLHTAIRRQTGDLDAAIDDLLGDVSVVCFDEFHVHDPADGVFIGRLLPALLDRDVRLILTSNHPPGDLMPNPLFHQGFAPTIDLIERALTVVTVDGPTDYRTTSDHATGFAAGAWVTPGTHDQLGRLGLTVPPPSEQVELAPAGHPVRALRAEPGCLWFDFADLCGHTTAPADYLALASRYHRWVVDGVPDLHAAGREPAQRFANLVDVLYDHDIHTVFLAGTPLDGLATADARLPVEIARITSRLGQLRTVRTGEPRSPEGHPDRKTPAGREVLGQPAR
ncbi:cell division protein ZapE [Rhodococcus olei]|uniref:Cell division protein ZapE n=1 Tax=Rhodococcus olei TaxID=2161675 RepID=A0ABP8PH28_9NOCA